MKKYSNNEFIKKAKEVHGNKYNYSNVEYINSQTKVCIICPEHGEFWQTPANHLQGQNCPKCSTFITHEEQKSSVEDFIKKAKEIHGDKYDYSKVSYINNKTKVCIICPEHGEFWQRPDKHIFAKRGCPKCGKTQKLTKKDFIEKAKLIHKDTYDYSNVEYKTIRQKVEIICKKHGSFMQTPHAHLSGQGCPICKQRILEKEINEFLIENNIKYEYQKKFDWLGKQSLDFYLPEYNIAIECQGIQHFESVEYFGGEERLKKQIKYDVIKKNLCEKNGIKLLYYTKFNENFIFNLNDLKDKIYDNRNL